MSTDAGHTLARAGADGALRAAARPPRARAHRWVFAVTVAFLGLAAVLRSVLAFGGQQRLVVLALLAAWFVLVLAEPVLVRAWAPALIVYLVTQGAVIGVLLAQSDSSDFFAVLLAVPVMQAMQRRQPRAVAVLIGAYAVLTGLALAGEFGAATAPLVAIYCAANVFFAAYALAARRSVEARVHNEALAAALREANRRLEESSAQARRLGAARERQRLARDLHDSVTQTLFSMTLTAGSALLLLRRGRGEAGAQLEHLVGLARHALEEMSDLGTAESLPVPAATGFVAALERHCAERGLRDGLEVVVEVDGDGRLPGKDGQALLRIAQEALNNVVKHSQTKEAVVLVRLRPPFRLEVRDRGRGFDPGLQDASGLGLTTMRERAAEIGWRLVVTTAPGGGTCVLAEEAAGEGGGDSG
ncbi:MAG: Sensor histidine kinase LiaS [Actinobacteria bacterium ADurb.BinA094]|nr:MAG: Sensor histidine kinase LiaS [Actinobacteria bacterium ADurb.BinA094]